MNREAGRLGEARAEYEESLATRAEIGDRRGMAIGKVELGAVLLAQGEIAQARQVEDEAVQIARETKLMPGEAYAEFNLGEIAIARGDLAAARTHHERSLALRLEMNETRTVLESRLALAELALEEGRPADAERGARQVDESLGTEPSGPLRVRLELLVARAHLARGAVESAAAALSTARRFAEDTERSTSGGSWRWSRPSTTWRADGRRRHVHGWPLFGQCCSAPAWCWRIWSAGCSSSRSIAVEGLPTVKVDANALVRDAEARGAGLIVRHVASADEVLTAMSGPSPGEQLTRLLEAWQQGQTAPPTSSSRWSTPNSGGWQRPGCATSGRDTRCRPRRWCTRPGCG